ncbi:MAG: hypothetical protein ACYTAN_16725 [Planctomycetota bacterium]|jgi:hypothetical protein
MPPETAKIVVVAVASVGLLVWVLGVRTFLRLLERPNLEESTTQIKGKSAEEVRRTILQAALGPHCRIVEKSEDTVVVEPQWRVRIGFKFEDAYGGANVTCITDLTRLNALHRIIMGVLLTVALIVIGAMVAVMWALVIPSGLPAIRWQAVQAIQIIHFLWPPFIVSWVHGRQRLAALGLASNLLTAAEVAE